MSRELTGEKRPHISRFKGGLKDFKHKELSDKLQAPCRANTQAVLTGVELPPLVYVADNRANSYDILNAVSKAFEQYKRAFAEESDTIKGFNCPNDILEYNKRNPKNPIVIARVAYQHHNIKPMGKTLFDELAKGWQL